LLVDLISMADRADFVKKIEDELRKPKAEQNQDLLAFWTGQLVQLQAGSQSGLGLKVLELPLPFPDVVLAKADTHKRGSIHASSVVSGDEATRDQLKLWFKACLASSMAFDLVKPDLDERQVSYSWKFADYINDIEHKFGFRVYNIEKANGESEDLILQDSQGWLRTLSGYADYIIADPKADTRATAKAFALCVVEIQSDEDDEERCECQLQAYLVILIHRYGYKFLTGVLVLNNGTCRAYRAEIRPSEGKVYESKDCFPLYQIVDVLPNLLKL